ncbi:GNAT family N-acetyltransferase [Micromonospora sp. NPDC004704]
MIKRPYADHDLPRLQETFADWIAAAGRCGYDHIGELPHRIYENLRGQRPVGDLVHLWEDRDTIVGLAINLRFGSAFDVFTAPPLRGTPAELRMLRDAYETTAGLLTGGSGDGYVLTDVFDCDTTRIGLLNELGFVRFRTWDDSRERDLSDPVGDSPVPTGFVVRSARMADAEQLAAARKHSFDDNWTGELYRTAVMEKPGYQPEREIVVEAPDGRIAAFAVYWVDVRNGTGHFEPVGTHPEFQRRGLARAVMLHAMRLMRAAGMTTVTINHDTENEPAARLYESLGFHRRHQTYGYHRPPPPHP